MKRNQRKTAWGALMILLLGWAGVLQLRSVRAGGPSFLVSPGVAFTWGGSPPAAPMTIDTGALGILDPTLARSNLLIAAGAWQAITSSSITLPDAGIDTSITGPEGTGDFAVSNYIDYIGSCGPIGSPQISPMIFDNEDTDSKGKGDIFEDMG